MNAVGSVYSSAMSGLRAASRRLEASANNVANLNTDGFEPSRVALSDLSSGGVRISISDTARAKANDPAATAVPSGTDPIEETVAQTTAAFAFRANLRTLYTAQSLDAALLALGDTRDP